MLGELGAPWEGNSGAAAEMGQPDRVGQDLVITILWAMGRHPRMIQAHLGWPTRTRLVRKLALRERAGHRTAVKVRTGLRAQRKLRGPVRRVPRPEELAGSGRTTSPVAAAPP